MLITHALIKGDPVIMISKLKKRLIIRMDRKILQNEDNGVWKIEKITKAQEEEKRFVA